MIHKDTEEGTGLKEGAGGRKLGRGGKRRQMNLWKKREGLVACDERVEKEWIE